MKLARFLGCVVLAAPMGLAAQNASYGVAGLENLTTIGPEGRTIAATRTVGLPNLCPVSVEASHLADGDIVRTGGDQPEIRHGQDNPAQGERLRVDGAKGAGQRLHLKLKSPDQRTIDRAVVRLRGYTATGRTERLGQVSAGKDSTLDAQKLTVYLVPGADHTASVDVWAPGLTAIVSVELLSVKYSDGSTWMAPEGKSCRVTPEPLMLITQR